MIEITEAREEHVPALGDLWWKFMSYHEDINPIWAGRENTEDIYIQEFLHPAMEDKKSLVLVSLEDGTITGYSYSRINTPAKISKRDNYGYIHDMFIENNSRRTGTGQKMLGEIYRWFRSQGITHIEVQVAHGNSIGDSFWRKQGFTDESASLFLELK